MHEPDLADDVAEQVARIEAQVAAVRRLARSALRRFLDGASVPVDGAPEALAITAGDLDRYAIAWASLVPTEPEPRSALAGALAQRFGTDPPAGESASLNAVDALEQAAECAIVRGGQTLLEQGEPSDDFYVILSGRLVVARVGPDGGERVIRELVRGDSIGEMAALTGEPRSARVYAVRDSHLLRVSRAAFERVVARFPDVLRGVILTLVNRQRAGEHQAGHAPRRTLALLPLQPDVPMAAFADGLVAALEHAGPTRVVNAEEAGARPGGDLQGWLNGLEETHRFVIYQADASGSEWSAHSLRQADCVLLVASATGDHRLSQVEQLLGPHILAPRELVLLHPPGALPSWTSRWLGARQVAAYHHVRLAGPTDFGRLARRLVGRAIGLVLGGGGARAFAHIGALRALDEAGVPVDVIGGASAGAIIAAQYALGWEAHELYVRNRELARRGRTLIDYTVPLVSLIQARAFMAVLHELFGERRIEDLWLPFWCLSSNLTRATKIVHRSGPLAAALRTSCALPGVLPPVLIDGDVAVDGGLVDTVPVATMNEVLDGGGLTVAVDVSAEVDLTRDYDFGLSVSGLRLLAERLNPFARPQTRVPGIAAVLLRSIELASVMHRQEHQAESHLFIKLPVAHVDRLAFGDPDAFEHLVELGYTHTCQALQAANASGVTGLSVR